MRTMEDCINAAYKVDFIKSRRELELYATALYQAIQWGSKIEEQNRKIRELDNSIK